MSVEPAVTIPSPDAAAIRHAQRGDAAALEAVARAALPKLRRWARALVASADDADDIAQAALIRATRRLDAFHFQARLDTWLYGILRREVAEHFRRAGRERRRRARVAARAEVWGGPQVPDVDAERAADRIRAAFRDLPGRQREVFDLVDLQGLSPTEAAGLLGLAAPTVRVHLLRARRTLRALMIDIEPALVEDRRGLPDRP